MNDPLTATSFRPLTVLLIDREIYKLFHGVAYARQDIMIGVTSAGEGRISIGVIMIDVDSSRSRRRFGRGQLRRG